MLSDSPISLVAGDLPRKWIADDYFDLIVWYRDNRIAGFQLCYGKPYAEQSLTWIAGGKFINSRIDEGEESPTRNRAPVLRPSEFLPIDEIISQFNSRSRSMLIELRSFILDKLESLQPAALTN